MVFMLAVAVMLSTPPAEYTVTAYCPTDPQSVEGLDFSGDPSITASGRRVELTVSCAAPKHLPFSTWLYVADMGWYRVDDRGGRIGKARLDITTHTRKAALAFGKRKLRVYIPVQPVQDIISALHSLKPGK
jgi:3D (Asp-Asp-Asp) domain-containing protein